MRRRTLRGLVANNNFGALFIFIAIEVVTVAGIVLIQEGQRRIPVQYAKRIRGNRMYGGQSTHIPLRVNSAGMIPLIFASSLLLFPAVIAQFFLPAPGVDAAIIGQQVATGDLQCVQLGRAGLLGHAYFVLVVGFTYFYTAVTFQQQNLPENLQKYRWLHPGHSSRPADTRVPEPGAQPHHVGGRSVPWHCGCHAVLPEADLGQLVHDLLQHGHSDRRWRCA